MKYKAEVVAYESYGEVCVGDFEVMKLEKAQ